MEGRHREMQCVENCIAVVFQELLVFTLSHNSSCGMAKN
jgi:hypothetical protein